MISAVIPAYNEEKFIGEVVEKAKKFVDEVIVVDDCSTDRTAEVAMQSGAKVIRNEKNLGKAKAIKKGLEEARGEIIVMLDADMQHDPEDIPKLVEPLLNYNADVVLGSRFLLKGEKSPILRFLSNKINRFIVSKLAGRKVTDSECGYRAIRKDVLKEIDLNEKRFNIEPYIIIQASLKGYKIIEVPVKKIYGMEKSTVKKRDILYRLYFYIKMWVRKRRGKI